MNRATEEQLIYTIKNRMEKTDSHYEDHGNFIFYDMGCLEPDTHLRGFTIRHLPYEEKVADKLSQILESLPRDRVKTWRVRMPSPAVSTWRNFLEERKFFIQDEAGIPAMERSHPIERVCTHSLHWLKNEKEKESCVPIVAASFNLSHETVRALLSPLSSQELAMIKDCENKVLCCGILSWDPTTGYGGLYYIATDPKYRGKGLAKDLVTEMTNYSLRHGAKKVILQASTLGKFVYDSLGYQEVGRYLNFIYDGKNEK